MDPHNSTKLTALLDGPALAPPPGVTPNLVDPPNQEVLLTVILTIGGVLSTVATCTRLYVKIRMVRRMYLEDYLLFLAWLIYTGYWSLGYLCIRHAKGMHQWDMTLRELSTYLLHLHIGSIQYGVIIMLLKVAILVQIKRVFSPTGSRDFVFWTSHFLIWMHVIFYTACTFAEIFACSPQRKAWDVLITSGACLNIKAVNLSASIFNVVTDIAIMLVPQRVIWRLNMSKERRLGLSAVFLVGFLATGASSVRLYETIQFAGSNDLTYWGILMGLVSSTEMLAGFLVLCSPVIPKLFRRTKERATKINTSLQYHFPRPKPIHARDRRSDSMFAPYISGTQEVGAMNAPRPEHFDVMYTVTVSSSSGPRESKSESRWHDSWVQAPKPRDDNV